MSEATIAAAQAAIEDAKAATSLSLRVVVGLGTVFLTVALARFQAMFARQA